MIKYLNEFRRLTVGEQVFTLVWAWGTRKEKQGDWPSHMREAVHKANSIEF